MDGYILGILWALGRYSEDSGARYFFLRHKDRFFLDAVRHALNVPANIHTVTHKGKPQYRLKISGFDFTALEALGWQPRWEAQRTYPRIVEHRDFIRAYLELHSGIDTLTIRKQNRPPHRQPRLRIYGNKAFLEELTGVLAAEVGTGIKKVQKSTNESEVSGILYYTSLGELRDIIMYLYQPETRIFNREYYDSFQDILRRWG